MKKIMIMLIALISVSAINATVLNNEQIIKGFKNSLKLNRILYDGLLNSTTEFSQEEYDVGDTIDVTIHFEVNTTKNTEGLKFAVVDYKDKALHAICLRNGQITKEVVEYQKEKFLKIDIFKLIESDPDLILSNESPTGDYHFSFKFMKKCPIIFVYNDPYPHFFQNLIIYAFTETKTNPYITEYKVGNESGNIVFDIPIKLHPDARVDTKKSDIPEPASEKPVKELPTKQTPVKIGRGEKDILQVVHAFVFNV